MGMRSRNMPVIDIMVPLDRRLTEGASIPKVRGFRTSSQLLCTLHRRGKVPGMLKDATQILLRKQL